MPIVQSDGGPLGAWLEPFAAALGRPAWRRALVLVAGAILAPGRRTVASALRVTGLGNAPGFAGHHRLLSEGRWSVSGAYGPLSSAVDGGGFSDLAQHHGISSSMRLLGQPLTRRVSRSVK